MALPRNPLLQMAILTIFVYIVYSYFFTTQDSDDEKLSRKIREVAMPEDEMNEKSLSPDESNLPQPNILPLDDMEKMEIVGEKELHSNENDEKSTVDQIPAVKFEENSAQQNKIESIHRKEENPEPRIEFKEGKREQIGENFPSLHQIPLNQISPGHQNNVKLTEYQVIFFFLKIQFIKIN